MKRGDDATQLESTKRPRVENPELEDEEQSEINLGQVSGGRLVVSGQECPYLDTINRQYLDFDFEKCCSVSLRQDNVYVCLVCGKYFQVESSF